MTKQLIIDYYDCKIGPLIMVFDEGVLCALDFMDHKARCFRILTKSYPNHRLDQQQDPFAFRTILNRYLTGEVSAFENIPVILKGTEFQQQVWQALHQIPAGHTVSYGDLARLIGRPKAVRALGHANSMNPIALVIPCHRVIGKDGTLTGYAGGLERKEWLLRHEGALG
ncbi:MAG: methylated-DNA--[protein]-cysteine S-methyltransferase [Emcibacter sp.]|nr:methylated-DNA--[protein]-cysteine S-methyltransferase [Emcibacter sp.]